LDGVSARRKASAYTGQHNTEKRGHISIPERDSNPRFVFERLKTVRALGCAAVGAGVFSILFC